MMKDQPLSTSRAKAEKRPYEPPDITDLGSIEELTQSNVSPGGGDIPFQQFSS